MTVIAMSRTEIDEQDQSNSSTRGWSSLRKRRVELLLLQPLGSIALQICYERGYCRVLGISRRAEGLCRRAPKLFSKIWGHQVGR